MSVCWKKESEIHQKAGNFMCSINDEEAVIRTVEEIWSLGDSRWMGKTMKFRLFINMSFFRHTCFIFRFHGQDFPEVIYTPLLLGKG